MTECPDYSYGVNKCKVCGSAKVNIIHECEDCRAEIDVSNWRDRINKKCVTAYRDIDRYHGRRKQQCATPGCLSIELRRHNNRVSRYCDRCLEKQAAAKKRKYDKERL
jgi:hypothetical protein